LAGWTTGCARLAIADLIRRKYGAVRSVGDVIAEIAEIAEIAAYPVTSPRSWPLTLVWNADQIGLESL
jgi:hypothetical protein